MIHPERFGFIFIIAGLSFFVFAFIVMAVAPILMLKNVEVKEIDAIAQTVSAEFIQLEDDYPEEFAAAFGKPAPAAFSEALRLGRDTYIAEACWHCHSQFVRPVSRESLRFGKVSDAAEYMNKLQLPQLFGTRRVGPDLIREAGKHSNDWHVAHFYEPSNVVPVSVMPSYQWLYDSNQRPTKKALALVTYMQWLGSWARTDLEGAYRIGSAPGGAQ